MVLHESKGSFFLCAQAASEILSIQLPDLAISSSDSLLAIVTFEALLKASRKAARLLLTITPDQDSPLSPTNLLVMPDPRSPEMNFNCGHGCL